MSRAQEENIAIKTVGENDEDNAYEVVDESKRKSKCDQEGPSSSEGEGVQSLPNDDHTAADQSALKQNTERCDKGDDQEEKRDHVYANVLLKESKAATFCKTTASRYESLQVTCTEDGSTERKDPLENLNPSSLEQGLEMNSNEATSEQDPLYSRIESNDHFYEVIDKSKEMATKVGTFNNPN